MEKASFRISIQPQNLVSSQQYLIPGPLETVPSWEHIKLENVFTGSLF